MAEGGDAVILGGGEQREIPTETATHVDASVDAIVERVLQRLGREGIQPGAPTGTSEGSSAASGPTGGEQSINIQRQWLGGGRVSCRILSEMETEWGLGVPTSVAMVHPQDWKHGLVSVNRGRAWPGCDAKEVNYCWALVFSTVLPCL